MYMRHRNIFREKKLLSIENLSHHPNRSFRALNLMMEPIIIFTTHNTIHLSKSPAAMSKSEN